MNYEANIQRFRIIDRKGNIYFIFWSSEALLNNNQTAKQCLSAELFAKILLELNALLITKDYIMLASGQKRHNLQRISSKCQRFTQVIFRSSRPKGFFKRNVPEDFARFTGNPLYWSLFLIKLQSSILQLHFKKRLQQHTLSYEILRNFQEYLPAASWFFTISSEVPHYAFLFVGFFNKTLLMKIFGVIFAMPVATE